MSEMKAHAVAILVLAILSWYYFINLGFPVNIGFTNAVVAFGATFLIALSFFLGPLARIIPALKHDLIYRKTFGLWGYSLALIHLILASFNIINEERVITLADLGSLTFAGIAFMIFTMMALTSTYKWMQTLGYENWKSLQRVGYMALLFVLIHIALIEQGVFLTRTTGQIAIGFMMLILLLRGLLLILGVRRKKPYKWTQLQTKPQAKPSST